MLTLIIAPICFLAIIDTMIGNRVFPGKVSVIKRNNRYIVSKINRYFFIPIKEYLEHNDSDRILGNFSSILSDASTFYSKDDAIHIALVYCNKSNNSTRVKEVWSSRQKTKKNEKLPSAEELIAIADELALATTDEEKLKILKRYE